jgi:hypothetical protein
MKNIIILGLMIYSISYPLYLKASTDLFQKVKPALFQIMIAENANAPKKSYGSGFAVHSPLLKSSTYIITNYHVIADSLQDDQGRYKVFVHSITKPIKIWQAEIVAVDLVHDVALIEVPEKLATSLPFSSKIPNQGAKVYSFGIPKDLDPTISEGRYNGLIAYDQYEQIHLTSAVNSGMSGGPTINDKGEVIGINVAVLLDSQSISFAVPVKYAAKLVMNNSKLKLKLSRENIHKVVNFQVKDLTNSLMRKTLEEKSSLKEIEKLKILNPPEILKCWSKFTNEDEMTYMLSRLFCQLNAATFIKDEQYMGTFEINYTYIQNKKRNALQFNYLLRYLYIESTTSSRSSDKCFITKPLCFERSLMSEKKIPFVVNICLMAYENYPDLFVADIKALTQLKLDYALMFESRFIGFTKENIEKFLKISLNSIELKN